MQVYIDFKPVLKKISSNYKIKIFLKIFFFLTLTFLWYFQVPNKGLSTSARGRKREVTILGVDPRKITSEKGQRRRPNYPPWVYVDNYSYV